MLPAICAELIYSVLILANEEVRRAVPYCPKCGSEVPADATFCTSCGAPLGEVPPPPSGYAPGVKGMSPSENLSSSFNYAKALASDVGRYVILLILNIIPVVNLIVTGYGARIIKTTPEVSELPKLERYGDLFIDGLKIAVAGFVYMIIPAILMGLGAGGVFAGIIGTMSGSVTIPTAGAFALTGLGALLLLVGLALAFVLAIFFAMGIAHMLRTNNFGKVFAFGEIRQIIGRIGWGRYIGWLLVLFLIAVVLGAITGAIPFPFGTIISLILGPFLVAFYFRSVGTMYGAGA
jgi:hypothetical protein